MPPHPHGQNAFSAWLTRFWRRVTDGLEMNQLWAQFQADARASYHLYSREVDFAKPQGARRGMYLLRVARQFFWAVLDQLSPARRVILLLALFLVVATGVFTWHDRAGYEHIVDFDFRIYGALLLVLLLVLEVTDRVVMKRDLQIAREIQTWLVPSTPPQVPGLEIAFAARPANTVAGDYYDVFPRAGLVVKTGDDHAPASDLEAPGGSPPSRVSASDPNSAASNLEAPGASPAADATASDPSSYTNQPFLFAVADVAGKSIPAALLMASVQASLKTLSTTPCSLAELADGMNRYVCSNSQGGRRFVTAFLAEYSPADRTLAYINAGHNPPLWRRALGTEGSFAIERLEAGGLPLGIEPGAVYETGRITLRPGDWLAMFTDGLVEATNEQDEEYGEERVIACIQSGAADASISATNLISQIMVGLDMFVGKNLPLADDVTCVLVKSK